MNRTFAQDVALRTQHRADHFRVVSPDGFLVAEAKARHQPLIMVSLIGSDHPIVTYSGHRGGVYRRAPQITALCWSPDGTRIASGASDGSLQVWDARRGVHLRTLVDLDEIAPVQAIVWHGDTLTTICGQAVREWRV